jgi:protein-S-isoprenylcysteine O-methyltransferase Ste14
MLVGIGLRVAAMTTLRAWFVTEISVPDNQPLVQRGIYGRLRHPSEAGTLAIALGAGLLLQSKAGLLLWLCGLLPLVRWRLRLEERELATAFGARFDQYAARVPRLLPRRLG